MECQRNWLYLESIFSAPDIQRQLPNEAKMFVQVDKSWKDIMRQVHKLPNCIQSGTRPGKYKLDNRTLGSKRPSSKIATKMGLIILVEQVKFKKVSLIKIAI